MSKIIINGSHQIEGNTSVLIEKLFPEHEIINLIEYKIELYNYNEKYSTDDDFISIIEKIINYDEIVLATPVYWYSISSLMKIFFDRLTDLLNSKQELGYQLKNKKVQVITTSNGNNLNEIFFEPIIATCEYLGMYFTNGEHFVTPI